jgi:dihydroflavonol-4-reductase
VTGATGFIGGQLVAKLIARGDRVMCLVRNPDKATNLAKLGVTLVQGDVADRAVMREAMGGVDGVFHLAALYKLGLEFKDQMHAANVAGTRNTLEAASEAGVPKIVYTSAVAVFGNTRGRIVGETYHGEMQILVSEYECTKWAAHSEVAMPLQQGAPIVIVQPGSVTGRGDTSPLNDDGDVAGHLRHSGAHAVAAGLDRGSQFRARRRAGEGLSVENGALV